MRLTHFHTFQPICPWCRASGSGDWALAVGFVSRGDDEQIQEGALCCTNTRCYCEYPIVDGIPLLMTNILKFLAERHTEVLLRDDLSPELISMIHEGAGAGSWFDSHRNHLSSYTWDHYGEFDPAESAACGAAGFPGAREGEPLASRGRAAAMRMDPGSGGASPSRNCCRAVAIML